MKGHFNKLFRNIAAKKGKNEFEKRLIKATYGHDSKEPKEKHVQFLFTAMHGGSMEATPKHVLTSLNNRAMDNQENWAVNMKVLIIYHKLLQDKKLSSITSKELQDSCIQFYSYNKETDKMKQNERIIQMISKRYVEYLQALCGLIQNESKLTHLPKDKELYEPIIKKMNEKSLIKFLDRLQTLVELITEQFESKDFCQKSRLHSAYLISLFEDYSRIYTIYNYGVTIAISMFSTLSSRKKNDLINSFEFFCKFNSEFKTNAKILPLLLNIEYKIPEISEIDPDTLRKLKKQGSKTSRSNTIVQPSVRNKKQNQEINNEDEIEFDENDEPLPTRTQSVVYKTSTKSKPIKQSRIQVEEFNTNALDNLLLSDVPDKKRQTMNPKQLTNEFFDWDQEEQKQEEKDNIFEQAHDVDDFEEAPQDIDKLLFDPKISLESTQPKTGIRSTNSNIQSSEGRFSAMSNGFNNPFAMNQNPGYGMQYGGNQFYQGGYGNFQTSNMNRFSAPIAPNSYKFNY